MEDYSFKGPPTIIIAKYAFTEKILVMIAKRHVQVQTMLLFPFVKENVRIAAAPGRKGCANTAGVTARVKRSFLR